MAIETATDRAAFLSVNEFGVFGTYASNAASREISGIFDSPSLSLTIGAVDVTDRKPSFLCAEDDLPGDADGDAGDTLTVDGVEYVVTAIEPDGSGMARLWLGAS